MIYIKKITVKLYVSLLQLHQNIPSHVHVIALDLPGHGFTSPPLEGDEIGFEGQLKRVKQVWSIFQSLMFYFSEPRITLLSWNLEKSF